MSDVVVTMTVTVTLAPPEGLFSMTVATDAQPDLADYLADGRLSAAWLREAATLVRRDALARTSIQRQGILDTR